MKYLIVLITIIGGGNLTAQMQEYLVSGVVKDSAQKPIPGVKVYESSNKKKSVYSNNKGYYQISLPLEKGDKIVFDHVGFDKDSFYIRNRLLKSKVVSETKKIQINSELSYMQLPEVVIGVNKVDTVFGSEQYAVEDFMILENDQLLLLAYEKKLDKNPKLLLVNSSQEVLTSYTIPGIPQSLFKDFGGKYYVVCRHKVYTIIIRENRLALMKVSNDDFYGFYNRVIDTIGDNFYFSNFNELYPAVKFYVTAREDTANLELYEVKDDFMMELYRAQYKYVSGRDKLWAYRQEQATGIDKEVWIGASSFTHDILYKPVYAPLFVINDTVLLFDQYKSKVIKYSQYHDVLSEVSIDYHLTKNKEHWEQPLIKDQSTDKIYAIFDRGGYTYLKSVNHYTGKTSKLMKLKFRFIEKIKIVNNEIYYIYRPFESLQKKFLYKESIK